MRAPSDWPLPGRLAGAPKTMYRYTGATDGIVVCMHRSSRAPAPCAKRVQAAVSNGMPSHTHSITHAKTPSNGGVARKAFENAIKSVRHTKTPSSPNEWLTRAHARVRAACVRCRQAQCTSARRTLSRHCARGERSAKWCASVVGTRGLPVRVRGPASGGSEGKAMAAAAAVRRCRGAAAVARPLAVARPRGAAAAARVRRAAVRAADEAKASSIARLDALLGKPEVAAPAAEPAQEQREAAEPAAEQDAAPVPPADVGALYASLGAACDAGDVSATRSAMAALSEAGVAGLYGSATGTLRRRTTSMADLSSVGIKQPESIATPEERDDQGFLTTVLLTCSVLAVAGGFLPGDWGFFVPYLTGAIVLVVLAVGSTAPGLMYAVVDNITGAAQRANEGPEGERTLRHEAAHMLVSYCLGTPVISYSLDLGAEHTDLAEASLDRPLALKLIDDAELDRLAVMAMAGVAAEVRARAARDRTLARARASECSRASKGRWCLSRLRALRAREAGCLAGGSSLGATGADLLHPAAPRRLCPGPRVRPGQGWHRRPLRPAAPDKPRAEWPQRRAAAEHRALGGQGGRPGAAAGGARLRRAARGHGARRERARVHPSHRGRAVGGARGGAGKKSTAMARFENHNRQPSIEAEPATGDVHSSHSLSRALDAARRRRRATWRATR